MIGRFIVVTPVEVGPQQARTWPAEYAQYWKIVDSAPEEGMAFTKAHDAAKKATAVCTFSVYELRAAGTVKAELSIAVSKNEASA